MAYDDDDLFDEDFDFVDDDDAADDRAAEPEESSEAKPKPRARGRDKDKDKEAKPEKPASRAPKRAKGATGGAKAEPRRPAADPGRAAPAKPPSEPPAERAPVGYLMDDEPVEDDVADDEPEASLEPAAPAGPPADHVVHVYEFGVFKRTIDRKFTDEEAVGFAEEYTRTGKAYGRYAIATPEDEEPAPTFAGAAKG